MQSMKFTVIFSIILMLVLTSTCNPGPPFRRLPFNGSMYGKRTSSILPLDYDTSNKAFSSLCEMATEVCTTWFPQQVENN